MTFKMILLAFSVLLISKVTFGKINCKDICERSERTKVVPREVSDFKDYCVEMKSYLRCLKEWQDECGQEYRVVFFGTTEIFQANYDTLTEICEEGTLLNAVATENLKCVNETFSRTRCHEEAGEVVESFIKRVRENEEFEHPLSVFCLRSALATDCVLRAMSDNCGKTLEDAALEAIHRSKYLKHACTEMDARSDLDTLDNLDLNDDKKRSVSLLLSKLLEENND
ncbi:unnamed protein product [Larinioides sclopetarius]|uniref:Uncharacterized protein n=1 Tax=Larinioides sclopetarius TaxID=280406 RepID=A0AAV2BM75_9ARAC